MDYYSLLGVSEDASTSEIKRAFRKKAFDHHPDATQNAGPESKEHFQKILQAYETLRDPVRRTQYDALKAIDFDFDGSSTASGSGRDSSGGTPYGPWSARPGHNPTMDEWERQFDAWINRMNNQYGEYAADTERIRKERANAERRLRAQAWEREKMEASEVKNRSARVQRRAENAKYVRQAATMRKFWQGRSVLTWQDAAVGAAFVLVSVGVAYHWKTSILASSSDKEANSSTLSNS